VIVLVGIDSRRLVHLKYSTQVVAHLMFDFSVPCADIVSDRRAGRSKYTAVKDP
jgi:hypothetical protein